MKTFPKLSALIAALLLPSFALAQDQDLDPHKRLDGSWIVISGTVEAPKPDRFRLDYGSGLITVEMDDWDWYAEDYDLLPGYKVTVYGAVDHDTYEAASIEAASVYVEELGTYFHAGSRDDEGWPGTVELTPDPRVTLGDMVVTGIVTEIGEHHFTIDSGKRRMTVEITRMPYNPLDDEGYQQVEPGDRVSASGRITEKTFEQAELVAESVVTLQDAGATEAELEPM